MATLPTFGVVDAYVEVEKEVDEEDHDDNERRSWGWLAYVATHPKYRRQGLATNIISQL